ncbi:related to Vacuolar protein sorting-associated protein 27 [Saccharomycodes ludwigii]|uniref:Vacuolar protein sorting-associated protein 27 n=1 Tax=Saccharomycodes ludwigii TaxID=36035 RepID=A0A376B2C7_9ASCO|nr:related to Vacuolar protein sorting-associated protein 27 [Saccharomycodes ludwigii]
MPQVSNTTRLDALIEQATSENIPNGDIDLATSFEVSDVIRSRAIQPKDCMRCLKKRITSTKNNPNVQLSTWRLLDICLKNGGLPFIREICSREFMECFESVIIGSSKEYGGDSYDPDLFRLCCQLLFDLTNLSNIDGNDATRTYNKLTRERNIKFDTEKSNMMDYSVISNNFFDSKTPADWIDSDACMICSDTFNIFNRKHHCRSCGGIFCNKDSAHFIPLPDLGIMDEVRVCDNCYDDYSFKKQKYSNTKKKHRNNHHTKIKTNEEPNFDDDLQKAIALSLQESGQGKEEKIEKEQQQQRELSEEEDPDLKAAIEASLKEAEKEGHMKKETPEPIIPPNTGELSTSEEEDIYLFASLVEKLKGQPVTAVLQDNNLAQLYQNIIALKGKLNSQVAETAYKYNTFIDMNAKLSDITNIYDSILERQLQSINLSQQKKYNSGVGTAPIMPTDPYMYYTQTQQSQYTSPIPQPQYTSPVQLPQYTSPVTQLQYTSALQQPQHTSPVAQPQYTSPVAQPQYTSPVAQPQYTSPVAQPQYTSPAAQPQYTKPSPVQQSEHPSPVLQAPQYQSQPPQSLPQYVPAQNELQSIVFTPSEAPYPEQNDEVIPTKMNKLEDNAVEENGQSFKSETVVPYPIKNDEKEMKEIINDGYANVAGNEAPYPVPITKVKFPTVPVSKPSQVSAGPKKEEEDKESQIQPAQEEMLIEL